MNGLALASLSDQGIADARQVIDGPVEGLVMGVPLSDPSCNTLHCNPPTPDNMTCGGRDILFAQSLCNQSASSNVTCSVRSGETSVFTPKVAMRADVLFSSLYHQAYYDLFQEITSLTGTSASTQLVEGLVNQAVDNLGNNQLTSVNVLNTTYAYTVFMRADMAISEGRKCWNCLCGLSLRVQPLTSCGSSPPLWAQALRPRQAAAGCSSSSASAQAA